VSLDLSMAYMEIAELAIALGAAPLNQRPGAWVHRLDAHWVVALNGHSFTVDASPGGGGCDAPIRPFHAMIWYNGWPAGILAPTGGAIAAGEGANEDTLIDALRAARASVAA
jgi:hypothetical protein